MSTDFQADDGQTDGRYCPICRSYGVDTDNGSDAVTDTVSDESLPSDADLDSFLDDIFGKSTKSRIIDLDGPQDVDGLFAAIFAGEPVNGRTIVGDSQDIRDYPHGPIFFKDDEIRTIKAALKAYGTKLCDHANAITDPENDTIFEALSGEAQIHVTNLVVEAVHESVKARKLFDWFNVFNV